MSFYFLQLPDPDYSLWSGFTVNLIDQVQSLTYDIRFNIYDNQWYILNLINDQTKESIAEGKRLVPNYPLFTFERKSRPTIGEILFIHQTDISTKPTRNNIQDFFLFYITSEDEILKDLYKVFGFKNGF